MSQWINHELKHLWVQDNKSQVRQQTFHKCILNLWLLNFNMNSLFLFFLLIFHFCVEKIFIIQKKGLTFINDDKKKVGIHIYWKQPRKEISDINLSLATSKQKNKIHKIPLLEYQIYSFHNFHNRFTQYTKD